MSDVMSIIFRYNQIKRIGQSCPGPNSMEQEETMKKLVIIMMLLAFVGVSVAIAADSYTYDNKKGTVTFNHKEHQDALGDCAKCHEGEPAKIVVDKKAAHGAACKDCHKEMGGPTKCNDCHKK